MPARFLLSGLLFAAAPALADCVALGQAADAAWARFHEAPEGCQQANARIAVDLALIDMLQCTIAEAALPVFAETSGSMLAEVEARRPGAVAERDALCTDETTLDDPQTVESRPTIEPAQPTAEEAGTDGPTMNVNDCFEIWQQPPMQSSDSAFGPTEFVSIRISNRCDATVHFEWVACTTEPSFVSNGPTLGSRRSYRWALGPFSPYEFESAGGYTVLEGVAAGFAYNYSYGPDFSTPAC